MIATEVKEVVDRVVGGQEALRVPGRIEPLHLLLAPPLRLVRVLGSAGKAFVPAMLDTGHDLPLRRAVARQLGRDHHSRGLAMPLQRLAQQALGGLLVAAALDQDVEHDTALVDGAPQPMLHSGDRNDDLIKAPLAAGSGPPAAELIGNCLADRLGRATMIGVAGMGGGRHAARLSLHPTSRQAQAAHT